MLKDSPSLRRELAQMIEEGASRAACSATRRLFGYGETATKLSSPTYTEEQVLGDWFPEPPKSGS